MKTVARAAPVVAIDSRLASLLGRRLSPVSELAPKIPLLESSPLIVSDARVSHPGRIGGGPIWPTGGRGQSATASAAISAAIGEALERHGATCEPIAQTIRGSFDSLRDSLPLIALDDLRLFSDEQLARASMPLRNIVGADEFHWLAGTLSDRETVDRETTVYYPLERLTLGNREHDQFDVWTTNGLAIHVSPALAREGALCEVLERDAFLTHWWLKRPAPLYTHEAILGALEGVALNAARWLGDRLSVLDLSDTWGVPVFVGLCRGRAAPAEPALTVAGSAGSDPRAAFEKCILESTRIFLELHAGWNRRPPAMPAPTEPFDSTLLSFEDAARLYREPSMAWATEFLFKGARPSARELRARLEQPSCDIQAAVLERGGRILVFDLTPIDLACAGLSLLRVVVPEAIPLNCAHYARPFGCHKLREFPFAELNPMPHPFL